MRRTNWKTVSTLVTMIGIAGCSERVLAPVAAHKAAVAPAAASFAPQGGPAFSLSGDGESNTSADFEVTPSGGLFRVGNHAVYFPANSICDPATSSYGEGTWDSACTVATSNIAVHAEVRTQNGRSWVDFTPALRFAPSTSPAHWVWMIMYTPGAATAADLSAFNIYYASSIGGTLVDETAADPSLRTYVSSTGVSFRRIKHFSGYTSSSFTCSIDPNTGEEVCTETGGEGGGTGTGEQIP